jgi:pimeloyl-ACP methyl ester carboxylesterase
MLTYAGYSYGSFLGVTYANLFPDKVRSLVVDGVLDPIAWPTGQSGEGDTIPFSTRLRSDKGAMDTLNEFFPLCDENPTTFAFSGGAADRYEGAQIVANLLPNSRLLSLNGWGHVSLFLSQCADQAVADYLLDVTLPAEGTVCHQDLMPFLDFGPSLAAGSVTQLRASLVPALVPEAVRKSVHTK